MCHPGGTFQIIKSLPVFFSQTCIRTSFVLNPDGAVCTLIRCKNPAWKGIFLPYVELEVIRRASACRSGFMHLDFIAILACPCLYFSIRDAAGKTMTS